MDQEPFPTPPIASTQQDADANDAPRQLGPEALLAQHLHYRVPLYSPSFPFILFWSQKAGCTSLVRWFFAQIGLLEAADAYHRWVHHYEQDVFKARPGYRAELRAALLCRSHRVVKVVRNPLRRAPSGFLVLGEIGAVVPQHHWVQDHWRGARAWLAERGVADPQGISFLDHLGLVEALESEEAHTINPHLAQQHVLGEEDYVDDVVPIERFGDWATRVADEGLAVHIPPERYVDNHHHHFVDPARTAALGPRPEIVPIAPGAYADGRFPASQAFVNERSEPLLRRAYRIDLAAYGHHYGL